MKYIIYFLDLLWYALLSLMISFPPTWLIILLYEVIQGNYDHHIADVYDYIIIGIIWFIVFLYLIIKDPDDSFTEYTDHEKSKKEERTSRIKIVEVLKKCPRGTKLWYRNSAEEDGEEIIFDHLDFFEEEYICGEHIQSYYTIHCYFENEKGRIGMDFSEYGTALANYDGRGFRYLSPSKDNAWWQDVKNIDINNKKLK